MGFEFQIPKIKTPKIKTSIPRGTFPRKRDIEKITNILNKPLRERVSAKTKSKVFVRAKNKCEWKGCKQTKYLHIYHKNMKSDDNNLSNLVLLCPNHHAACHDKYKRKVEKDIIGREISSKVVLKKQKASRKKENNPLNVTIPQFSLPKFDI